MKEEGEGAGHEAQGEPGNEPPEVMSLLVTHGS